jgi:DNA-binding XRE family transcriptional regulator
MDTEVRRPAGRGGRGPRGAPAGLRRRRPRDFEEWKALAAWGKLPTWEARAAGYQLRLARETAALTQSELAARLGISQQAVARAERWQSNPTVHFVERWAEALGARLDFEIAVDPPSHRDAS